MRTRLLLFGLGFGALKKLLMFLSFDFLGSGGNNKDNLGKVFYIYISLLNLISFFILLSKECVLPISFTYPVVPLNELSIPMEESCALTVIGMPPPKNFGGVFAYSSCLDS